MYNTRAHTHVPYMPYPLSRICTRARGSVHTGGHQAWLMVSVWPIVRFVSEARKKSLRSKSIEPSEKRALFFSFAACSLFCVLLRRLVPSSFQFARSLSSSFLRSPFVSSSFSLSLSFSSLQPALVGHRLVHETLNSSGGVARFAHRESRLTSPGDQRNVKSVRTKFHRRFVSLETSFKAREISA